MSLHSFHVKKYLLLRSGRWSTGNDGVFILVVGHECSWVPTNPFGSTSGCQLTSGHFLRRDILPCKSSCYHSGSNPQLRWWNRNCTHETALHQISSEDAVWTDDHSAYDNWYNCHNNFSCFILLACLTKNESGFGLHLLGYPRKTWPCNISHLPWIS